MRMGIAPAARMVEWARPPLQCGGTLRDAVGSGIAPVSATLRSVRSGASSIPSAQMWPTGQRVHEAAPHAGMYRPAGHSVHATLSSVAPELALPKSPGPHSRQTPSPVPYEPARHSRQLSLPAGRPQPGRQLP